MKLVFSRQAWQDYLYWQANDAKTLRRINDLLEDTMRNPFRGTGKPEPLKHDFKGWWSRRIVQEHRLVYQVYGKGEHQSLEILQMRFHY